MATREKKNGEEDSSLKDNFLSVFHSLKFSKSGKDDAESVDVDRRCLATQYMATKKFGMEDETSLLLQKGLQSYQDQMGNRNGVNNYWPQIKAISPKVDNDPLKWKSLLKDPKTALQFVKPLPCQTDNTKDCQHKQFTDRHIKDIVSTWKNANGSQRNRKVSSLREAAYPHRGVVNKSNGESSATGVVQKLHHNVQNTKQQKPWNNDFNSCDKSHKLPKVQQSSSIMSDINTAVFRTVATRTPSRGDYESNNPRSNFKPGPSKAYRHQDENPTNKTQSFKTAKDELRLQQMKNKHMPQKRTLGGRTCVNSKFICPLKRGDEDDEEMQASNSLETDPDVCENEILRNIDPQMVELVKNEIMDSGSPVSWNDIAGLEFAKKTIQEIVVFPLLRPDIFTGLRRPPKGILLFGPPGTGKTLIGKCIASQSKSTFFSISASSITSKWIGQGEKMVRALFAVARVYQPAVVFIDEIDSLLSQRSDSEHESSRRIKTEFLVQLDGAATGNEDRILVVGATNRPQELDEAARRRLVKRLYIPLPEFKAREQIINNLLALTRHDLSAEDVSEIAKLSDGYSGADVSNLCKEASMGPIRSIPFDQLESIREDEVRQVTVSDFKEALSQVRSSVSQADLASYIEWERTYGTGSAHKYNS